VKRESLLDEVLVVIVFVLILVVVGVLTAGDTWLSPFGT
jgi:preprotein translocase subunit SecE